MEQPNVACGQITFSALESLITAQVHQKWSEPRLGLHNVDADLDATVSDEFEINGELYRLEYQGGKRVLVKTSKSNLGPKKPFSGKCWRCDRTGHFGRDCKFQTKEGGKPLNPNKKVPAQSLESPEEFLEETPLGSFDLSLFEVIEDPWTDGPDPWGGKGSEKNPNTTRLSAHRLTIHSPASSNKYSDDDIAMLDEWLNTPVDTP